MAVRIRKYDVDFSRRSFLQKTARGILGTGLLMPLWPAIARAGTIDKVYPDELLSIDMYTRGRITTGDTISADNVDYVKELLDPIQYHQISEMGRRLKVVPTTTEITGLNPHDYIEATLRNQGTATFDQSGNVVTGEGKPWLGGNPFPDPKTAIEVFAACTLSWGRHDVSFYPVREIDLNPDGSVGYEYEACWVEYAPVGRVTIDPKPYWPGHEDKLRYQTIFYVSPADARGTAFLNIWPYDQNQFPILHGYLPAFKRVRRYPTNQRFEPLVTGATMYLSDAWAAGDPFLTWGNYRIVHRGPFLAGVANNWNAEHPNWQHSTHGGPRGNSFWDTNVELVPEAIVIDAEPVKYPRAPVGKKRVWFDARTLTPIGMVSYDRKGNIFKSFDGVFSLYQRDDKQVMDGRHPYWSWCRVHIHDIQTNRISRLEQVKEIAGGYSMQVNDPALYDRYLTVSALRRLGV